MRLRLLAATAALVAVGFAQTNGAAAQRPRAFSLNWVREAGAESCVSSQELARRIEQMLGPVFAPPADADFAIEGRARHDDASGSWQARIVVSDHDGRLLGERELRSIDPNCRKLDPVVVLAIATAIDPEASARGLPPELMTELKEAGDPAAELLAELQAADDAATPKREPPPPTTKPRGRATTPPASASVDTKPPVNAEQSSEHERWHVTLSGGLAVGAGLLPNTSTGPRVAIAIDPIGFWPLVLSGVLWLENDATLAEPTVAGDTVHFHMAQASLLLCPRLWRTDVAALALCGGLTAGSRWTNAPALTRPASVSRWYMGPVLGPEFVFLGLEPLEISFALALHAPLRRDRFTYIDPLDFEHGLYRPSAIAGWGEVGAGLRF